MLATATATLYIYNDKTMKLICFICTNKNYIGRVEKGEFILFPP